MNKKSVFTNNGSVRTGIAGKNAPAYTCWKKIETMVKGDDRWIVDPVFLEYSSFHKWYTSRGNNEGLIIAYNCVGQDDYQLGPDTTALLPKRVWQALLSRKPGLTPFQRLNALRAAIDEHKNFFVGIPKIRTLLWNYRYSDEETAADHADAVPSNPYAAITLAIAEKVNYSYDKLSDDMLFELYFDLQETLVEEAARIRVPGWVHLYTRILEAVKATPTPKPVEPPAPLSIDDQVEDLRRDVKMAVEVVGELETRLDKVVEMVKPTTITEMCRTMTQFHNSLQSLDTRLTGVVDAVKKEHSKHDATLQQLLNRIKHLEDLQLDKMESSSVSTEPATVVVKSDESVNVADTTAKVKPVSPTLPEVVIVGLAPESAQRITKEYSGRIDLIILPLNVNNKRLKAVCKDRTVVLMTAFSSHHITNTIKSVTDKVTTVGNGITALTRELDKYILQV